jgi:hypothetical protein
LLAVLLVLPEFTYAEPLLTNASISSNVGQVSFDGGSVFQFDSVGATAGATLVGPHVNVEAQASYGKSSGGGASSQQIGLGGVLLWWAPNWRSAVSLGQVLSQRPGPDTRATHLHAYGVWFPTEQVTLSTKGGGFTGHANGEYAGAAINVYLTPDLAFFGAVDRTWFDAGFRENDWTGSVQWLPTERLPLAVGLGVTRNCISGRFAADATTAFINVRLFYNRSGHTSLSGRERTGPTGWPSSFRPSGLSFLCW